MRETHRQRMREGDRDHLVFYLLQSTAFTTLPAIEPARSAQAYVASGWIDDGVRARVAALAQAMGAPGRNERIAYFASLLGDTSDARSRERAMLAEYPRVMRFLHDKEFGPGRRDASAAAALYRTRGLSTDTAVEAGFLVDQGLSVLRALEPGRRIRHVLIVGPGLDLAPRTGLLDAAPPQSYQPWAVLDALLASGLSTTDDLEIVAADINPRVVDHVRHARRHPPTLVLVTGVGDTGPVRLAPTYRAYVEALGRRIGEVLPASTTSDSAIPSGHVASRVQVSAQAAQVMRAVTLDVATERLDDRAFDLVIVTNVFPYFDEDTLGLALANIAAMLAPDGVLLHNEARETLLEMASALGLPAVQSRHAVIATVQNAPPLGDSLWMHVRRP